MDSIVEEAIKAAASGLLGGIAGLLTARYQIKVQLRQHRLPFMMEFAAAAKASSAGVGELRRSSTSDEEIQKFILARIDAVEHLREQAWPKYAAYFEKRARLEIDRHFAAWFEECMKLHKGSGSVRDKSAAERNVFYLDGLAAGVAHIDEIHKVVAREIDRAG